MKFFDSPIRERIGYDFYCDVASRVVEARKAKGLTQEQLARASGISVSRLARLEAVQVRVYLDDLKKLSGVLGVSVDWLIEAKIDSQAGECLYLISLERLPSLELYQKSTSKRLAFLQLCEYLSGKCRYMEARDRAIVRLVGIPVTDQELKTKFKDKIDKDSDEILPDEVKP